MDEKNVTISEHVNELRKMLIICIGAVILGACVAYGFLLEDLMAFMVEPIKSLGLELKFTGVSEAFIAYLKVALLGGAVFASPIVIWQLLHFILPALYKNERKIFLTVLFFALLLFLVGLAFGYYVVLRMALRTLIFDFSGQFDPFVTVQNYFSFVGRFMLPFGLVFEIPLFVYFLTKIGMVTPDKLAKSRKYIIVAVLIIGAILTPPDVISQVLLAVPMYLLFEVSIILSKIVYRRKCKAEENLLENYDK